MKENISSFDVHYVVKELQGLLGSKLDKLQQSSDDEFIFQFHISGKGKQALRVVPGKCIYFTKYKFESLATPTKFCLFLRKKIQNARLTEINQKRFERIIEFVFKTKETTFKLLVELFHKGNIILTDENNKILSVMLVQVWKDRVLKPKEEYKYPKLRYNFVDLSQADLDAVFSSSEKDNVVKCLAIDLGLGGVYAEELCLISKVDKNKKPGELTKKEIKLLYDAVDAIRDKKIKAFAVMKEEIIDIVPFELKYYKDYEKKAFDSFNEALDEYFTKIMIKKELKEVSKIKDKNVDKLDKIIKVQTKQINKLEKDITENQRKGELLYENYALIESILDIVKNALKKHSWKEIKAKLRGHKVIKEVNEKEKKIIVEI